MAKDQHRTIRTMCPMNCHPTLCGMLVDVDNGRLVGVRGDKENPDSQGFLCVRGHASQEIIANPKRLLYPLIRHRRTDDAAVRGLHDGAAIRIYNERGALHARARVTDHIPDGTVWMRDGWDGLNSLTSGQAILPDAAVDLFGFSAGQASFEAMVEVVSL